MCYQRPFLVADIDRIGFSGGGEVFVLMLHATNSPSSVHNRFQVPDAD